MNKLYAKNAFNKAIIKEYEQYLLHIRIGLALAIVAIIITTVFFSLQGASAWSVFIYPLIYIIYIQIKKYRRPTVRTKLFNKLMAEHELRITGEKL